MEQVNNTSFCPGDHITVQNITVGLFEDNTTPLGSPALKQQNSARGNLDEDVNVTLTEPLATCQFRA